MDIIKQCNDIMMKSINAADTVPDLRVMSLKSELYEAKRMALDLGIMCEEINRRCADQAALISTQQKTICRLQEELANVRMSR